MIRAAKFSPRIIKAALPAFYEEPEDFWSLCLGLGLGLFACFAYYAYCESVHNMHGVYDSGSQALAAEFVKTTQPAFLQRAIRILEIFSWGQGYCYMHILCDMRTIHNTHIVPSLYDAGS